MRWSATYSWWLFYCFDLRTLWYEIVKRFEMRKEFLCTKTCRGLTSSKVQVSTRQKKETVWGTTQPAAHPRRVKTCETHEWCKTIWIQRSHWEVNTIEPRKAIARKQRKTSLVFTPWQTPAGGHGTLERPWDSLLRQTADVSLYHGTKFSPYFPFTVYCFCTKICH